MEAQQLGINEAQLLLDYPHITAADLVNAWAYADAYSEEIAAAIHANSQVAQPMARLYADEHRICCF